MCYSRTRRELWRLGDGHYAIDGHADHGTIVIDEVRLAARWAYVECLRQAGVDDAQIAADPALRDVTGPLLRVQHHFANAPVKHPLAYGVLNGKPVPTHLREVVALNDEVREVALSSDGYPLLLATLAETERYRATDLRADPLRTGAHRGFTVVCKPLTSYDDRAYARVAVH